LVPDPETSTTRRLARWPAGLAATVGPFLGERLHGRRHSALYIHTNASGTRIRGSLRSGRPSATIPAHRAAPAGRGRGRKVASGRSRSGNNRTGTPRTRGNANRAPSVHRLTDPGR